MWIKIDAFLIHTYILSGYEMQLVGGTHTLTVGDSRISLWIELNINLLDQFQTIFWTTHRGKFR